MAMVSSLTNIIRLASIIIIATAVILPIIIILSVNSKAKKKDNNQNDSDKDAGIKYYWYRRGRCPYRPVFNLTNIDIL